MKSNWKSWIRLASFSIFAGAVTPAVFAGCGDLPGKAEPANKAPYLMRATNRPPIFILADTVPSGASIVGLWHVTFTQNADFGGGLFDDSYAEWHSDGTEIMNSGVHNPGGGNFCMGVWLKTGPSSYKLKHLALDYSLTHKNTPDVIVVIREDVAVDASGNHFTGSFTADLYAPYSGTLPAVPGNHIMRVGAGTLSGDRVTTN